MLGAKCQRAGDPISYIVKGIQSEEVEADLHDFFFNGMNGALHKLLLNVLSDLDRLTLV